MILPCLFSATGLRTLFSRIAALCILPYACALVPNAAAQVTIDAETAIYLPANAPKPLELAALDLVRDMKNTFGKEPQLLRELPETTETTQVIYIATPESGVSLGKEKHLSDTEAHRVFTARSGDGKDAIVLQGADMRGAIYAIYTFSEEILGVPPMWAWTSWTPKGRESIEIPADTDIRYDSPYVRYRAWFPNDQDYMDRWKRRGDNLSVVAETMLRLKLNAWDISSVLGDDLKTMTSDAQTASNRGLISYSTHTSPLGARITPQRWETFWRDIKKTEVPPLEISNIDNLVAYWEYVAETVQATGIETIWTVTFRSHGDHPFWRAFKDAPDSDQGRADIIRDNIMRQVQIVRNVAGEDAVMRIPLYNEMSDFAVAGLLKLPQSENIIWNFVAARRDHYPPTGIEEVTFPKDQPLGLYFNIQFTSTGSHLVQGEGPWKMEENFRVMDSLTEAPLGFSLVNSGNTREFIMELEANARMMWDFEAYTSDAFLLDFCRTYFGEEHAAEAAALYYDYYNAYWQQYPTNAPKISRQYIFHDLRYSQALREITRLLKDRRQSANEPLRWTEAFMIDPAFNGVATTSEALLKGTRESGDAFAAVAARADKLAERLPEESRPFFYDNLQMQAHIMTALNRSLNAVTQAVALPADSPERKRLIQTAADAFSVIPPMLQQSERGLFSSWYPKPGQRDIFRINELNQTLQELSTRK